VFQNAVPIGGKMVRRMTSVTEIIKLDSDTNQLIFMAPFTWVSKTDDRFESSKTSKILNKIKQQNDWSDEQLEEELENRMIILQWMMKKNVSSYQDFGRIIADYQKQDSFWSSDLLTGTPLKINSETMNNIAQFLKGKHTPLPAKQKVTLPTPTPGNLVVHCRRCGSDNLNILYGKFGYYFKCKRCNENMSITYYIPEGQ